MKKITILLIACSLLALAGCQEKSDVALNTTKNDNTNTTLAVNLPDDKETETTKNDFLSDLTVSEPNTPSGSVVEIKEKMFIAQMNDVYLNPEDYLGKTIKYEGMFTQHTWDEKEITYYLVYRNSPGCCGADGQAGFEVIWPDGSDNTYPNEDDWVEAMGVLEEYEEDGYQYLRMVLSALTVLPTRGAEFVSQ